MTGFVLEWDADDALRRLGALLRTATSPREALDAIGFDISQRVDLTFDAQQDPWNRAWAPLSPATLSLRRKGGKGAQVLRDTGRLSQSVTHNLVSDTEVDVGTNVAYARAQQLGNPSNKMFGRGSAPIPARPFLPIRDGRGDLPPSWAQAALDMLGRFLEGARDGA